MFRAMRGSRSDFKIVYPVVSFDAVLVMDNLMRKELPAEIGLDDEPMLVKPTVDNVSSAFVDTPLFL